jgi:hypothetical protein
VDDGVIVGVGVMVGVALGVDVDVGGRGVKVGVAVNVGVDVAVGVGVGSRTEQPPMNSEEKAQSTKRAKRTGAFISSSVTFAQSEPESFKPMKF